VPGRLADGLENQAGVSMKWPVYWRVYRGHLFAILAAAISLMLLMVWVIHVGWSSTLGKTLGHQAEPLLLLVGALVLFVGGTRFVGNLREIRAQIPSDALEKLEDGTLEPWRAINHSFSGIEWTPEIEPRLLRSAQEFCRDYRLVRFGLLQFRLGFCIIEQLGEETGTTNFRLLKLVGREKFIRIYKNVHRLELTCREKILELLVKREVFESRDCRPLRAQRLDTPGDLIPGHALSDTAIAKPAGVFHDVPVAIQVFPFADFDGHFRAKRLGNLFEVGRQLGRIQSALPTMTDAEGREEIVQFQKTRAMGKLEMTPVELLGKWEVIHRFLPRTATSSAHPNLPLLDWEEVFRLDAAIASTAALRTANESEPLLLLLHDIHPHNVVMKFGGRNCDDTCVLIYDYYWTGLWNHGTVTALAIHRFVREFVRTQAPFPAYGRDDLVPYEQAIKMERAILIRRATHVFLRGYQDCDKRELPPDFLSNVGRYINSGNVEKLLGGLSKVLGLEADPLMRSQGRLAGEVRKFVRFTKEANAFAAAFHGAPSVPRFIAMSDDAVVSWDADELATLRGEISPQSAR
jgi:hypothetical protein